MKAIETQEHGRVVLTLDAYRKAKGFSKNQVVKGANMQRTQFQRYCNNQVTRVELDVLARICNFLDCSISDILHYEK